MQTLPNYKLSDGTELEVKVCTDQDEVDKILTESDKDMDKRAVAAVEAAISKAKICKNPVTYYDNDRKAAYIEYADGTRKYAK